MFWYCTSNSFEFFYCSFTSKEREREEEKRGKERRGRGERREGSCEGKEEGLTREGGENSHCMSLEQQYDLP